MKEHAQNKIYMFNLKNARNKTSYFVLSAIKMTRSITILIQIRSRMYTFNDKYARHSNRFFCVCNISIKPLSRGWECNCVIANWKYNYVSHSISQPLHFDFEMKLLCFTVCSCKTYLASRISHNLSKKQQIISSCAISNSKEIFKLHAMLMQTPNLLLTSYSNRITQLNYLCNFI